MKRIEEVIKIKVLQLDNVKVEFKIKLLQWQLNNCIYKYKNKFAYPEFINRFIEELAEIIKHSTAKNDNQAEELSNRLRDVVKNCRDYQRTVSITPQDLTETIDKTLRYILYQYSNNKANLTLNEQIELLQELKLLKQIIETNHITQTDRIKNAFKLIEQLRENIIKTL